MRKHSDQSPSPISRFAHSNSSKSSDVNSSAGPDTIRSNTLIGTANIMKNNGMEALAADVSTMSLNKMAEGFSPAHPSAVPTPLYKRSTNGLEDDRARADSIASNTFEPVHVPMAPPADLLTHFGVVNEHLRSSTLETHRRLRSAGEVIVSEIQAQHRSTVVTFNDGMRTVYNSVGQMEQKITALVEDFTVTKNKIDTVDGNVAALKADVDTNIKDIKDSIGTITQSLHGLVATSDKVLTINKSMSKKITELVQRVQMLESTQGSIVTFLSDRHASFPPIGSAGIPNAPTSRHHRLSNAQATPHNSQALDRHDIAGTKNTGPKRYLVHDNGRHVNAKPHIYASNIQIDETDHGYHNRRGVRGSVHSNTHDMHYAQARDHAYGSVGHPAMHDPFSNQLSSPATGQLRMPNTFDDYNWTGNWNMNQANQQSYYYGHPALSHYGLDNMAGAVQATAGAQNTKTDNDEDEKENLKDGA